MCVACLVVAEESRARQLEHRLQTQQQRASANVHETTNEQAKQQTETGGFIRCWHEGVEGLACVLAAERA